MLRVYFQQQWFNMSDPQDGYCLYDSEAMRKFIGIDLGLEAAPYETTICKFRHLIEDNGIGKKIFTAVNEHLGNQWYFCMKCHIGVDYEVSHWGRLQRKDNAFC
jgi:IS5 family transposase